MKSQTSVSIGKKIAFLIAFLVLGSTVIGFVSFKDIRAISGTLTKVSMTELPATRSMAMMDMFHDGISSSVYKAIFWADRGDVEHIKSVREDYDNMVKDMRKNLKILDDLEMLPEVEAAIEPVKPLIAQYIDFSKELVEKALSGKKREVMDKMLEFDKMFSNLEVVLAKLGDLVEKEADQARQNGQETAKESEIINIIITASAILLSLVGGYLVKNSIIKLLNQIIADLNQEAEQMDSNSKIVEKAAQTLNAAADDQNASLQSTAASIDQITAMIKKTAGNSTQARQLTLQSREASTYGQQSMAKMIEAIQGISKSNKHVLNQVHEGNEKTISIVKMINEIGTKTKIINDIVFQTKLLSFNASVEAARAGEHGKGFAVVAQEIGNLAQVSGNASKEIGDLLNVSVSRVNEIVRETKEQVESLVTSAEEELRRGNDVVQKCVDIFDKALHGAVAVSEAVEEISQATTEQANGIEEINRAMGKLDKATHQNAEISKQIAATAEQLAARSSAVMGSVDVLRNIVSSDK